MTAEERWAVRLLAKTFVGGCVALVAWLSVWKTAFHIPDERTPWVEVVFGPVLLCGSILLMLAVGIGIELLIRALLRRRR